MELDQLLTLLSSVSDKVIPILAVVALIFVIVFLRKLIVILQKTEKTMDSMNRLVDHTDDKVQALQKPVETLQELSGTVDQIHAASKNAARSVFSMIIDNMGDVIRAVKLNLSDKKETEEGGMLDED